MATDLLLNLFLLYWLGELKSVWKIEIGTDTNIRKISDQSSISSGDVGPSKFAGDSNEDNMNMGAVGVPPTVIA